MQIVNTAVYGISESTVASGYPLSSEVNPWHKVENKDRDRAKKLSNTPHGSGHDNFLQGIIVQADFQMPSYWWPEAQRYHHFDFVSSQSKMHCLTKFDIGKQCAEGTWAKSIEIVKEAVEKFKSGEIGIDEMMCNVPMGFELTARMTTNYRQLKTMYAQRKDHRLACWRITFCEWVKTLPMADTLIVGTVKK